MTLRKPGLQEPLSSPPSPESEGPGNHTLPGGATWPGGAEMNILEAIKLQPSLDSLNENTGGCYF